MSLAKSCCSGYLLSSCNQYIKSTKWGTESVQQTLQRTGRVNFTNNNCWPSTFTVCFRNSVSQLPTSSLARLAISPVRCSGQFGQQRVTDSPDSSMKSDSKHRGLFQIAALIGCSTFVSKLLGLARETVLAAVFGVGPVINAFSYASIIPGFFLTLLGGINGPFHSAMAASLSKRSREEGRRLVQRLTIIAGVMCGAISMAIFLLAGPLVDVISPGLLAPGYIDGFLTRKLAIIQLKIMAPCAMLAALIGIGFGALSAVGIHGIPSLSPALSSITVLVSVTVYLAQSKQISTSKVDVIAAVFLAGGASIGALAQWGVQALAQHSAGLGYEQFSRNLSRNPFEDDGVQEVLSVLLPAAIASGMLQIATYTDLYFASFIPGAAAGLGYANLLAMAPLGIVSSSILVPLLPMFSRLSKHSHEQELQEHVRQALLLSMVLTVLMTALMVSLARPIVRIVLERHAFDASASVLVTSLLICYALGSTCYLARDLLVRVFYALGDGHFPLQVSTAAICTNAVLDWLLVRYAGYGVQGLVLATSLVNCASAVALLVKLSNRLKGLQLRYWIRPLLLLGCSGTVAGIVSRCSYEQLFLQFVSTFGAVSPRSLWAVDFLSVILASGVGGEDLIHDDQSLTFGSEERCHGLDLVDWSWSQALRPKMSSVRT